MRQRAIGLAIDTVGSYGRGVIHGVMEFCHRNPHWVIAIEPRTWVYTENEEPDYGNVDGLIVQAYSQEVVNRVRASGCPAINVSNTRRCKRQLPTIIPDDHAIGRLAADYLLTLGVQHYGFCGQSGAEYSVIRAAAFMERMAAAGVTVNECDNLVPHLDTWLASLPKPAAIFCCNDLWAYRTLSACRRGGFHVPDQVAVLGVDDDELLNTIGALPMSSIAIPTTKIGYEAAKMLEAALNGESPPQHTTLPPLHVVPRATTDVANVDDPEISAALRHIKANVGRPIQVDDLLEHLSVSRRSLERRFRAALGRSIAGEIRRVHIEQAKQLLNNTSLSIKEVAKASGFTSSTLLGVVFRRYVCESPTTFRQRSKCGVPPRLTKAVLSPT
jgi:LacI family transcriptional regulator